MVFNYLKISISLTQLYGFNLVKLNGNACAALHELQSADKVPVGFFSEGLDFHVKLPIITLI